MSGTARLSVGLDLRAWPVVGAPRRLLCVIGPIEAIAVGLFAYAAATSSHVKTQLLLVGFLAVLAVVFEEIVVHVSRLQLRLSADLKRDMTSVWAVAGVVALEPSAAALLMIVLYGHVWFRQQRPAGEVLYRKLFNLANTVTSCIGASYVMRGSHSALMGMPPALRDAIAISLVLVTFGLINRVVATLALLSLGMPARSMFGGRDDNLIEFATLCLGGLVGLAIIHQPVLAVLVIAPMVTMQRGAAMRVLEAAATTDAKTGLLNAVAWEQVASRELLRAAREGKELAVLIIDIDHFKMVNDVHGHLVGDHVLRRLARTLDAEVREFDTVARFGGEEFVAVLPGAAVDDAMAIAERLRRTVYELTISAVVGTIDPALDQRLAVSIGVAVAPLDGVEIADLLHMADAALYRAKAEGRNRVVAAADGPDREAPIRSVG